MTGPSDRRNSRRASGSEHGIVSARVRPGHHATIIDVSAGGALVEIATRLFPGAPVDVQVETAERGTILRGRVLRCAVIRLRSSCVSYQAAIAFDRQFSWCAEADPRGYDVPARETTHGSAKRVDASPESV